MIRVKVDLLNPGQYFACCGLLELANRLSPGAEGWFENGQFCINTPTTLAVVVKALVATKIEVLDPENLPSTRLRLGEPFHLTLDWWWEASGWGEGLRPWAGGSMHPGRIANALQIVCERPDACSENLFNFAMVVPNPSEPTKKVEPFYFDSRRKECAHSRDIGFSPNDVGMTTVAHPAVELLCLIGLQRARPRPTKAPRQFDYFVWAQPCPLSILAAAVSGVLRNPTDKGFRFVNAFRSGQEKHKAFAPAFPLPSNG